MSSWLLLDENSGLISVVNMFFLDAILKYNTGSGLMSFVLSPFSPWFFNDLVRSPDSRT